MGLSVSPNSFDSQVQEWSGQRWTVDVQLPPLTRDQARLWIAFLAALRGPRGTFYVFDPATILPYGPASGTPRVNGAGQTGNVLVTDGWTPSISGILKAGDKFQLGNFLYMVLQDADSNGSGQATLDIWPRLRSATVDDESLITVKPKGIFRLPNQINQLWSADEAQIYDVGFSAVEAI